MMHVAMKRALDLLSGQRATVHLDALVESYILSAESQRPTSKPSESRFNASI